jgi:hypothetical protein
VRFFFVPLSAAIASASLSAAVAPELPVPRGEGRARKKSAERGAPGFAEVIATLAQTHTGERVIVGASEPTDARFAELLADRATGQSSPMHPALLALLRELGRAHPGARIDLVSGFRSPKLNEMLRKKGHHVASHSQHTLGNAVDFRVVTEGEPQGMSPPAVERELRAMGWRGGIGVYLKKADWFVHADVGPLRRWNGQ